MKMTKSKVVGSCDLRLLKQKLFVLIFCVRTRTMEFYCFLYFQVSLEELFPELYSDNVKQMSLTLLYEGMGVEKGFTVSIKPMEMYSFLLRR